MTLMHHSNIPYAVAAEKAATWARNKYQAQLDDGRQQAQGLIKHLMDNQPKDNFVWHSDLDFQPATQDNKAIRVRDAKLGNAVDLHGAPVHPPLTFHRNALGQACSKAEIPYAYLDSMLEDGQADLACQNLNRRFHDVELTKRGRPRRYNLRSVGHEVRGFVSDSFPRWDSNALVEAFIGSVTAYGGIIVAAQCSDLRFSLKAVLPVMFEPIENEIMLLGMSLRNSDFGVAMYDISALVDRLRCTNLLTMQSEFAKRHLGRQYEDGEVYSQGTMNKETEALISATKDVVKAYLSPASIEVQLNHIKNVGTETIDADTMFAELRKNKKLTKEEAEEAKKLYRSADTELLPRGDTRWRLANALALLGQQADVDRGLELEEIAGEVALLKAAA
jgi:hypothetical protein